MGRFLYEISSLVIASVYFLIPTNENKRGESDEDKNQTKRKNS